MWFCTVLFNSYQSPEIPRTFRMTQYFVFVDMQINLFTIRPILINIRERFFQLKFRSYIDINGRKHVKQISLAPKIIQNRSCLQDSCNNIRLHSDYVFIASTFNRFISLKVEFFQVVLDHILFIHFFLAFHQRLCTLAYQAL